MLTFFSTPKPFVGHIDVIQRNALRSWRQIHPDIEILLFGDDAGAASGLTGADPAAFGVPDMPATSTIIPLMPRL